MEYVEILAMILKSDDKITKEYCSALKGINTQFFIDKSMIDDTPAYKNTGNGFIAIYEHEREIVLEYMFGGTGSIKSCTKKVKFEFNTNLKEDLLDLKPDKLTSDIEDDVFDYSQFCAACTMYNVKRDSVDFNHITETPKYSIDYYIRKFINNEYFLQGDLTLAKPIVKNNHSLTRLNLIFNIDRNSQKLLQSYPTKDNCDNPDDLDDEFDTDDYDDFDSECEYDDLDESPFDDLSKLGPGTYDLETGKFTPDDENVESEDDSFGR